MLGQAHTIRRTAILVALGAAIAAFTVPAALAFDGRSPDTKDAAALAHPRSANPGDGWYGRVLSLEQQRSGVARAPLDGRSPDTKDAALVARYQTVSIVERRGFDWGDFGIGVAVAAGTLLLLAGLAAGLREARQVRHRLGSA